MSPVTASESVTIKAPASDVLAVLLDLPGQSEWFPGLISSEVTETDAEGRAVRAHQVNDLKIAKDEYDLIYTHEGDSGFSWVLAAPSTGQRSSSGSWQLEDLGGTTRATLTVTTDPALPLPGFIVKKTVKDMVNGAAKALQKRCEA